MEHDGAASVDHEVKPTVVSCHGEALVVDGRAHPHADQAHAGRGHHLTSHHRGSAAKRRGRSDLKMGRRTVSRFGGTLFIHERERDRKRNGLSW